MPSSDSAFGLLILLWVTILGLLLYMLPAVIAFGRNHQHRVPILLTNLFFGWTFVGWVGSLVWSAMPVTTVKSPPSL
jgi:Superinfection immunity protein